jgi:hypothetical protein
VDARFGIEEDAADEPSRRRRRAKSRDREVNSGTNRRRRAVLG